MESQYLAHTNFIKVEEGEFTMREVDKKITVKDEFYIGKYPVTQSFYKAVMGENPSTYKGNSLPVTNVSWDDIHAADGFLEKLNKNKNIKEEILKENKLLTYKQSIDNYQFRLPTESEWEFAAQGGNENEQYEYAGSNNADEVAWYESNSHNVTMPVGLLKPNALGIYDMSGNVWEWCEDWYSKRAKDIPADGTANKVKGKYRVLRGGDCFSGVGGVVLASRYWYHPSHRWSVSIGFRLVAFLFQVKEL